MADTGELYAVRHGERTDDGRLSVLARVDEQALERELAGWHEVCESDRPSSYEWLRDRAAAAGRRPRMRSRAGTPVPAGA